MVGALGAIACVASLEGLSGGAGGDGGGSAEGGNAFEAGSAPTDGAPDDDASAGDAGCPRGVGPAMVDVPSLVGTHFCVDSTEVTQGQYQQFLQAVGTDAGPQGPLCAFNTDYAPTRCGTYDPSTKGDQPVTCVNWCMARAFCAWNGKRLCGRIGGGKLDGTMLQDPAKDEWFAACSQNGSADHVFPYGKSYSAVACNVPDLDAGTTWAAGSHPSCEGGFAGVFDMSGNAGEWQDACGEVDAGPEHGYCPYRGGTFSSGANSNYLRCDNGGTGAYLFGERLAQSQEIGVRCCAD
jgi:formylglycine-generating enzyme required for sulfatase activity